MIFFIHLYWSIIALQCCVSFCYITKWISYTYTYIPISPPPCVSLPPSLSHHPRSSQSTELISLCYAAASEEWFLKKRKRGGKKEISWFCKLVESSPQGPSGLGSEGTTILELLEHKQDCWLLSPPRSLVPTVSFWAPTTSWCIFCINLASALGLFPGISEEREETAGNRASWRVPLQGRKPSPAAVFTETKRRVYCGTGLSHTDG